MIKLDLDENIGRFNLIHDHFCSQHFVDEITKVIDTIIIDYEIKTTKYRDFPLNEKKEILLKKRKEYLDMILKKECQCLEYLSTPVTCIKDDL